MWLGRAGRKFISVQKYLAKFLLERLEGDVRITLRFISDKQQHVKLRNEQNLEQNCAQMQVSIFYFL